MTGRMKAAIHSAEVAGIEAATARKELRELRNAYNAVKPQNQEHLAAIQTQKSVTEIKEKANWELHQERLKYSAMCDKFVVLLGKRDDTIKVRDQLLEERNKAITLRDRILEDCQKGGRTRKIVGAHDKNHT